MANNGIMNSDRSGGETDFTNDPAAGGFFASDFRKHDDLKGQLDGNKDGLKLEAMKRIIGMVAKGKDASDLFPAVVKNVVSKNIEVKKLVYVYLVRYAEEQQDLALLSISTFQRALKDPNQLIRASALRVLSSIRVPVIVPIMMLAIKDAANDMSPYVRKTAAHAIPKLFSLDADQRDQLIEVIEKLLSDKTTLVVGSAVMAFEEVCPERIDLIHKNYRKLCNLLVDVEEWGQVVIIHMLTRYARMQFVDPNKGDRAAADEDGKFYDSEGSDDNKESKENVFVMDPDHRLLLRNCKPLLQSRNAAVVMSVAQLYYYIAPKNEIHLIAKALIRLLHSHREIQSVVLSNVATISTKGRGIFDPYMKNFFVRSSDPTHIKLLKLEILTNLSTETNIPIILREFQTYVSSQDMEFVAATIQAIGRCASAISEVTDTCLNGLVSLLSNRNEAVVAESVVVIKKLLQMQPSAHKDIIIHMTRLVDTITVPMARASILWLLGEYADRVTKIAPDVLRKVAKSYTNEEDIVKLQTLNLAAKLCLTNPKQTKLLAQYVFSLAKYDQNYDIRDRARFLKQLVMPQGDTVSVFSKYGKKILLAAKPAPVLQSNFKGRDQFQLGSLSHFINSRASDYQDLPPFPEHAPDPTVRNVEIAVPWQETSRTTKKKKQLVKKASFYSDSSSPVDSSDESVTSSDAEDAVAKYNSDDDDEETSSVTESESSGTETSDSEDSETPEERNIKAKPQPPSTSQKPKTKKASSVETSSGTETSESESSNDDNANKKKPQPSRGNLDLLLDLDGDTTSATPVMVASTVVMAPSVPQTTNTAAQILLSQAPCPVYVVQKQHELLNKYSGNGLKVTYRFTRSINIFSPKMTTIELTMTNEGTEPLKDISVPDKKSGGIEVKGFPSLGTLAVNSTVTATLGIDYGESTQQASFELVSEKCTIHLTMKAVIGEMLSPVLMTEDQFVSQQNKLKGMNENAVQVDLPGGNNDAKILTTRVLESANVAQVSSTLADVLRFVGQTLASKSLVLVTLQRLDNGKTKICVNCEKIVIGSVLVKELKDTFSK